MLNKAYILALIIAGFSFVAALLVVLLEYIFGTQVRGVALIIQFIAAYSVGQLYAQKQGAVVPKALRLRVSIYSLLISICFSVINLFILRTTIEQSQLQSSQIVVLVGVIWLISALLVYWGLGSGSKAYMKKIWISWTLPLPPRTDSFYSRLSPI
jgi:hypothetical protein